jgi:hypothetical protein
MRRLMLLLILIWASAVSTMADPNDLAGGVLITHYVHQYPVRYYTYCSEFDHNSSVNIDDAADQVCRMDDVSDLYEPTIWYVVAAFHEDKVWCGTQFGLGDYNPYGFYLTGVRFVNCLDNSLEIPSPGWPGPNSGISIAATDVQWEGNYRPICWFMGYTYLAYYQDDYTPTLIEVVEYPGQDFLGFGNCEAPSQVWPAEGGALGIFMDGIAVYPKTPGACCFEDGGCIVMIDSDCLASGGEWQGEATDCTPSPCPVSASDEHSWGDIKVLYQ